jgi:large subunit ribosomal protein L1
MAKLNKKQKKLAEKLTKKTFSADEAFQFLADNPAAKFDESIDLAIRLGVDTKQADQQVRGAIVLPNGVGRKVRVLVFAKADKEKEAQAAGADIVGADELIEKISGGFMEFDAVVATPDMMAKIAKDLRTLIKQIENRG